MSDNVFTYGTLQLASVMQAVTGKSFSSRPAILSEYQRYLIKNRIYPAIVPDKQASTKGTLYFNVDTESLVALDEFEDVLYDRKLVSVQCDGDVIKAFAYVLNPKYVTRLDDYDWSLDEFSRQHLDYYLERIEEL